MDVPEEVSPRRARSLVRMMSAQDFGPYVGQCLFSPIWFAVTAFVLEILPFGMTLSMLTKMKTDQFGENAYWLVTGSMVLQSLLGFPSLILCGFLSQPHRMGRKAVVLLLALLSTLVCAIPVFTSDAYIIVGVQTFLSCFAVGSSPTGLFTVVSAWITDWCRPEDKMTYFGILTGTLFGAISIAPFLPKLLHITGGDAAVFQFSALFKIASPVFIAVVFPRDVPTLDALPVASLARRFSASPGFLQTERVQERQAFDNNGGARFRFKPWGNISASLKYLFKQSLYPTVIYIMVNFSDAAVQDSIGVFLMKERGFTPDDLNAIIAMIGISGFVAQCLFLPVMNTCGVDPRTLLVPAVLAMVLHFGAYAFLESKLLLIVWEPIGAFGYVAVISTQTLVSGASSDGMLPRDQGTLLGTLGGLKMLASCIGPLVLAGATSSWRSLPPPLNWPGVGFAFLMFFMTGAMVLSIALRCQKRSASTTLGDCCESYDAHG